MDREEESERHRLAYVGGNKLAPLLHLRDCFYMRWPVPEWVAEALTAALNRIETGDAYSWNDVFDRPRPVRVHAHTAQLQHKKHRIWARVRTIHHEESAPIGEALFERVGREKGIGVSASVAKRAYYQVQRSLRDLRIVDDPRRAVLGR
jgi:hypothetical protein